MERVVIVGTGLIGASIGLALRAAGFAGAIAGIDASEAEVATAEAQLANLKAELPPFEQSAIASRHALAVLLGQQPAALDEELAAAGDLPDLPAAIPIGLPSTLARRRPDIRQSEAALHAATAQVGISVASMYPDISLTGTLGIRNLSPGYLFAWDSKFYTVGPSISVPIFQGGALVANVRLSRAEAAAATLNYRKTVLGALQEVEDGLTNLQQDGLRTAALRDTVLLFATGAAGNPDGPLDAFAAALEVIVYAGAIMVLFLFVIMMLSLDRAAAARERSWIARPVWVVPIILVALLGAELARVFLHGAPGASRVVSPQEVGFRLFTSDLAAVELASMLLLAGLVGAFHLGRKGP